MKTTFAHVGLILLLCSCQSSDASSEASSDAQPLASDAALPLDAGGGWDAQSDPAMFRVTPTQIQRGESALLEWNPPATSGYCRIIEGYDNIPHVGSMQVTPSRTTRYVLDCPGGTPVRLEVILTVVDADGGRAD